MMTEVLSLDAIKLRARHRKNLGDIASLARSIERIGLLHPPVVLTDGTLVVGERRIAALRLLGRESCPVTIADNLSDALDLLVAEADENVDRKDFAPTESVAMADDVEPRLREEAAEREAQSHGNRGVNFTPRSDTGKTRDKVAALVGMSAPTLAKAREVVAAAEEEPEEFGNLPAEMDRTGKVNGVYKKLTRARAAKARTQAVARVAADLSTSVSLRCCSVADLFGDLQEKPDIIITDPPYSGDSIALYGELARLAALAGIPTVAVMAGQTYLPDVLAVMVSHLTYRWTLAYLTPGGQAVQIWPRKVNTFWKPVLLFGKPGEAWIGDVCRSDVNDNDKRFHEWGQSESGMLDLVRHLAKPGDLVCDPFMGAGTTAVAALAAGCRFIGCDIDEKHVTTAKVRLQEMTNG